MLLAMAKATAMAGAHDGTGEVSRCRFDHVKRIVLRSEPWGCAMGREGHLYVAEVTKNRVVALNRTTGSVVKAIQYWTDVDSFRGPSSIAFDEQGSMLVADSNSGVVRVFEDESSPRRSIGHLQPSKRRHLPAPGNFSFPHMLSTVDDMLWVCDPESCCVQALYLNGTCKYLIHDQLTSTRVKVPVDGSFTRWRDLPKNASERVGSNVSEAYHMISTKLRAPNAVLVVKNTSISPLLLVVADSGNHVLRFFDAAEGVELGAAVGGWGKFVGELDYPTGIAMRSDGILLVAESRNRRIQGFEITRDAVRWLGTSCESDMRSVTSLCWDDNMQDIWACDPQAKSVRNFRLILQGRKSISLKKKQKQSTGR
uniref:SMP-30/Gluconolactonase/LRE-like region domain-containing protein n=1 Tax=Hanusia phi TaxID=3032 RepID=A0A7S0H7X0_9CRYP